MWENIKERLSKVIRRVETKHHDGERKTTSSPFHFSFVPVGLFNVGAKLRLTEKSSPLLGS